MGSVQGELPERKQLTVVPFNAVGGSGQGNLGAVTAESVPFHNRPHSISVTLPPLAAVFFKNETP